MNDPWETLGDDEGQGSLACCSPWCRRVRHDLATEQQLAKHQSKSLFILHSYPSPSSIFLVAYLYFVKT